MEVPGYVYDERVFILVAHVFSDASNPDLHVDLIIWNKDNTKADAIVFNNSYGYVPTEPGLMPDYSVVKTVTGNPSNNSTFTFRLADQDPTQPMPAGSVSGVKTITTTGSGTASFGKWSYTQPGTYYYTVSEVIPSPPETGYTYDTAVYTITDTVTDAGGQLTLSRVVTNASYSTVTSFTFINRYTHPGGPTPPVGPGTGDGMNSFKYATIFSISGALAVGAAIYLILAGKRKKTYQRDEKRL
jgi:pilin isopeptide linkage protein